MQFPYIRVTTLTFGLMTAIASHLSAQTIQDITVNNGQGTDPSDYSAISTSNPYAYLATNFNTNPDPRVVDGVPVLALGYVNANCVPDKSWDLEAFGYSASANTLTYVGGFNPLQTNEGYSIGDIFLSTGTVTQPAGLMQNTDYSNPGYTYAIHFTPTGGSTLAYSIYQLTSATQLLTVAFNQNLDSDPYALDPSNLGGATVIASGTTTVSAVDNAQVNTLLSENLFNSSSTANTSADNYVATFNLPAGLTDFYASLTEQCGNDALAGSSAIIAAPEPTSFYLGIVAGILFVGVARLQARRLKA